MRFLFATGQTPFDPTSGAAQATLHHMRLLAEAGHTVYALSTSGTEGPPPEGLPTGHFSRFGIRFEILKIKDQQKHSWAHLIGKRYDACFRTHLKNLRPDWLISFGDEDHDRQRRMWAKQAGARCLFSLHNASYVETPPPDVDLFLAPSKFLAETYRRDWGEPQNIISLPTPIVRDAVRAQTHDPVFCTFVNPHPTKGLYFMLKLIDELARQRPDIPVLVVGSRASEKDLVIAGKLAGLDLAQHESLFCAPAWADVRGLWQVTRILLMPSVWAEPASRLPLEAALNDIPCIVSDRGGLPEQVPPSSVHSLPAWMTPETTRLPTAMEVEPWLRRICELTDKPAQYSEAITQIHPHHTRQPQDWARAFEQLLDTRQEETS